MAVPNVTSLVAWLRENQFLTPAQAEEAERLQAQFPSPSLVREVVRRGWLTPYQANQLLAGKGSELVLGSYRVVDRLGEGGMGQVLKARHSRMGRLVALKVIPAEHLGNSNAVARFQREARAAATLSHPNIVIVYDADEVGGVHFLAMEYIEGADLAQLVRQSGPLPIGQACDFARQAALGLQHAFERGIIHRDIKPGNLLATSGGGDGPPVVKILDFGLARLQGEGKDAARLTKIGKLVGTVDYIAPEQVEDAHTADIRADIYSLGCSLFFLLTGQPPFPGDNMVTKLSRRILEATPSVRGLRPDAPAALDAVLARMIARDPAQRYQKPREVAAALQPFAREQSPAPAVAIAAPAKAPAPRRPARGTVPGSNSDSGRPAANPKSGDTIEGRSGGRRSTVGDSRPVKQREAVKVPGGPRRTPPGQRRLWLIVVAATLAVGTAAVVLWALIPGGETRVAVIPPPPPPPPPGLEPIPVDPAPLVKISFDDKGVDERGQRLTGTMRFGISALDPGQPGVNRKLTYDPHGRTNSTVVRIDGQERMFGLGLGNWTVQSAPSGGQWGGTRAVWMTGENLQITQTVGLIPGQPVETAGAPRRFLNTALVRYQLENKDTVARRVGLRIVVDTLIGMNDGVPFIVPGLKDLVTTAADFPGDGPVPDFLQALERPQSNLREVGLIAVLNCKAAGGVEPPGRVSLTAWPGVSSAWNIAVRAMGDDSAVVLYWPERELQPGAKREVGFSYGLSGLTSDSGEVGLTVGGDANPGGELTVVALVGEPRRDQTLTLNLPESFQLSAGQQATQAVPAPVRPGLPSPLTWRVRSSRPGRFHPEVQSSTGVRQRTLVAIGN